LLDEQLAFFVVRDRFSEVGHRDYSRRRVDLRGYGVLQIADAAWNAATTDFLNPESRTIMAIRAATLLASVRIMEITGYPPFVVDQLLFNMNPSSELKRIVVDTTWF
jgi:hypothetical protein